jgi:uncharacterized protein (TIGR02466 family)
VNSNLIPIFPKCLYITDKICLKHLDEFEESIGVMANQTKKNSLLNVNSSHTVNSYIHKLPPFNILEKEIMIHVKKYMYHYGYSPHRISEAFIQSMWFNISNKEDFLFPHIHPGSLLSGVFYIKTTDENVILFHDNLKNIYEDPEVTNEFSETIKTVKCEPGRLIIFSSDLSHSTPVQNIVGEKISISFNVVLKKKKR